MFDVKEHEYENADWGSFDSFRMLPPPPLQLPGYKVRQLTASQEYHQTYLLAKSKKGEFEGCKYYINIVYLKLLVWCGEK